MRIQIQLDDRDPPVGTASDGRAAVTFVGWLELISAIRLLLEGERTVRPTNTGRAKHKG